MKWYSGRTLKLYITFVPMIRTSKHFWLLQCIWHQTMVIYPWCSTTCSHWNHCIWSWELWEHKFLVLKNGLLFYRFMVEWVSFLHKMTNKGVIMLQMKKRNTLDWFISYDHIQWFQWLQVVIHHRYMTIVWCHMHWSPDYRHKRDV